MVLHRVVNLSSLWWLRKQQPIVDKRQTICAWLEVANPRDEELRDLDFKDRRERKAHRQRGKVRPAARASICCCLALSQVLFDGVLCQQSVRILVEPASLDLTVKRVVRVDSVGGLLAVRERKGA